MGLAQVDIYGTDGFLSVYVLWNDSMFSFVLKHFQYMKSYNILSFSYRRYMMKQK